MPLIPSKSKAAFKKNVKTEMDAHPSNPKRDLAIAYSVQRKAKEKKKYAKGGPVSAKDEARPGTQTADASKAEESRNRGDKPAHMDKATSRPDIAQSTKGQNTTPIKYPKMVPSSVFSTRLRDEEDHLESSDAPASPEEQPPEHDNEEGADRQGAPPHKMKMMAKGGKIKKQPLLTNEEDSRPLKETAYQKKQRESADTSSPAIRSKTPWVYAEGGEINELEPMSEAEQDNDEHPSGLESDNDMMGDSDAMNDHMTMMAEGGQAEMEADHHDSIAAAIMAKRGLKRLMQDSGSADEDKAEMMAEGGEVDLNMNAEEQPNGYYARNKAALKENYDEGMDNAHTPMDGEDGDDREDNRGNKKDKIEEMRKRAMSRRNFNK